MDDRLFEIILLCISILGVIITRYLVPYLKSQIGLDTASEIEYWVEKAVQAAEVLFDMPQSGDKKREYVISFILNKFNAKKEVITEEQVRILLEASWKAMTESCDK